MLKPKQHHHEPILSIRRFVVGELTIIENSEREARETQAALEVIIDQEYVKPSLLMDLYQESSEIVAILTTIAKRAKENQGKRKHRKT